MRREPLVVVCFAWLALVGVVAVAGSALVPYDPNTISLVDRLRPPFTVIDGSMHFLGTDELGRDYLSRLMIGTRASVALGLMAATIATIVGLVLGSVAGHVGGKVDSLTSRAIDVQLSFPALLYVLLIVVSVGPSVAVVVLVLAFAAWPEVARLARSLALDLRQLGFIESARAMDASTFHIIRRHVVPNLLQTIVVYGTILVATLMLASAGLDFLGLGLQPPDTSWGLLVANGRSSMQLAWWVIVLPGVAIFLTALSINLVAVFVRRSKWSTEAAAALKSDMPDASQTSADPFASSLATAVLTPAREVAERGDADAVPPAPLSDVAPGALPDTVTRPILEVRNLSVVFATPAGVVQAVRGLSWAVGPGEVLAIVGESGSGKSVTARTVMGILEAPAGRVTSGQVILQGRDLLAMSHKERRAINGHRISMVQQDAIAALDPVMTIGGHIEEVIRAHSSGLTKGQTRERALDLMRRVGIPDPLTRFGQYPFEFSGGMCQRVLIAMAIANDPEVLIADEPTTALDPTYQAQIMDLLMELRASNGMSVVLITHDLALVSQRADRVVVMYAGRAMESGPVDDVISGVAHPYTEALLRAKPDVQSGRSALLPIPGSPPNAIELPAGCPFHPRCVYAIEECRTTVPLAVEVASGHRSACHRALELYRHAG